METEDLDKILGKSYAELDASEKEAIRDICTSEEEFLQLQQFFASVESYAHDTRETIAPAPDVKERLDDLFNEVYRDKGILWYNSLWTTLYPAEKSFSQRPLVRIAAMLLVLVSIVPFLGKPDHEPKVLADNTHAPLKKETETLGKEKAAEEKDKTGIYTREQQTVPASEASPDLAPEIMMATYDMPGPANEYSKAISSNAAMSPAGTYSFSLNAEISPNSYQWMHPDGIYSDSLTIRADQFTVRENMAMLDLLTPAF